MRSHRLGAVAAGAACALALTTFHAAPSGAAGSRPHDPGKVDRDHVSLKDARPVLPALRDQDKNGRTAFFVRIKGAGAADVAAKAGAGSRGATAARARSADVRRTASSLLSAARRADGQASALYTVTNAIPGTGLLLDAKGAAAVARDPRVESVRPLVAKSAQNSSVVALVQALKTWKFSGTGKGVTIGIIDSGIDYTHADFGGPGTEAAYEAAFANDDSPTWRSQLPAKARKKVVGGYDFAGDDYDANSGNPTYQPIPHPDNNPLDCADNGHGSHVAGTAAGYGVNADGSTFKGKYQDLTNAKLQAMRIGPGTAPKASIYSMRVFGCVGSTFLVVPALDKALDPNGDGVFDDHMEIVSMSIGADYGPVDDPENDVVNELTSHGVLTVNSIGNNGDLTDTGGSPGDAESTLAVASSVDAFELRDGIRVNAPAGLAGVKEGQMSIAYDWRHNGPTHLPVTGQVVKLSPANADGCDPLSVGDAAAVAGKVAWLVWDSDDATRRCGSAGRSANIEDAGGIGALFTGDVDPFSGGITGSETIPVFQLTKPATAQLQPAVDANTLNVTFDGNLKTSAKHYDNSLTDMISDFTSRGPHGSVGVVKPDVTAPGDTVASAGVGSGNQPLVESGTSMATPATSGIAALVLQKHPRWTPVKLKAAIMNTARHDLWTGKNRTGHRYAPARVGAGRVDAKGAVQTKFLAYVAGPNNPVSASFGVVPSPIDGGTLTRTRTLTIKNLGKKDKKVSVAYDPINASPGVSYTASPSSVKVPAHGTKQVTITMTVVPTALRHTLDATMDELQLDTPRQYVSDASGRLLVKPVGSKPLRVPVYGAAKPSSTTTSSYSGGAIHLTGGGFDTGVSSTDYTSLVSVLEHGASSPTLPPCGKNEAAEGCATTSFEQADDIAEVGAGSTNGSDSFLYFAMSVKHDWTSLSLHSQEFDYDTDGDDEDDYYTYVSQIEGSDLFYALTYEILPGADELVDLWPVNFFDGDFDTNVFDTNVVILPVLKDAVGLPETGSAPVNYTGYTYSGYWGTYVDGTDRVAYDAGTPAIQTDEPLYLDDGGESIDIGGPGGATAMVVHLHGLPGFRVEKVDVPEVIN